MSFSTKINEVVTVELEALKKELIKKGVDKKVIEEVFNKHSTTKSSQTKNNGHGAASEESDEAEVNLAKRRMGSKNVSKEAAESVSKEEKKEKYPVDWSKRTSNCVIITDYSDKSQAIFGDFAKTYVKFKDEFLKNQKWATYNKELAFGPGWVIIKGNDSNLAELRQALRTRKIIAKQYTRDDFIKELKENEKESGSSSSSSEEEPEKEIKKDSKKEEPKKEVKKDSKKEEPKKEVKKDSKKEEPKKEESKKISKNKWGNNADENGFVYMKLPVGPKGKESAYVVGYQNLEPQDGEKGLDTVNRLDEALEEEATQLGLKIMTEDMIKTTKKIDKELGEKLEEMWNRVDGSGSENEGSGNDDVSSSETSSSSEE